MFSSVRTLALPWSKTAAVALIAAGAFASGSGVASAQSTPVGDEVVSMRSEMSRTFDQGGGRMLTRISDEPVNFRNGGGDWQPIDTDLTAAPGGAVQSTAGAGQVSLPGSLADGPVRLTHGSESVAFTPADAAPSSTVDVDGSTGTYADAVAGADAVYDALATGVKETIVVDRADAPNRYDFSLSLSAGLSARLLGDGSVSIDRADDSRAFLIPAPTVQEQGGELTGEHVRYALNGDVLSVLVDEQWLAQAARPVKIDPSIYFDQPGSCDIASGATANSVNCGNGFAVGSDSASSHRALLKYSFTNTDIPRDAQVLFARLVANQQTFTGSGPLDIELRSLTKAYTQQATWSSYNSINAWTQPGGDFDTAPADLAPVDTARTTAALNGDSINWELSKLAQSWVDGSKPNYGMLLKSANETAQSKAGFAGESTPDSRPLMQIVWTDRPGAGAGVKLETQSLSDRSKASVNVANGNLLLQGAEIKLPGIGLDVGLGSAFNLAGDGSARYYGSLGYGSSFGFIDAELHQMGFNQRETYAWRAPDGTWYRFDRDSANDTATEFAWRPAASLRAHLKTSKTAATSTLTFDESQTTWHYKQSGNNIDASYGQHLTKIVDRNNNQITLNYNPGSWQPDSLTDTRGRTLTFAFDSSTTYGSQTNLRSVTDWTGRQWKWTFNAVDQPQTFTDPDGKVTTYTWNPSATIQAITTPEGRKTVFTYAYNDVRAMVTSVRRVVNGTLTTVGTQDATWSYNYAPSGGNACPAAPAGDPVVMGKTIATDPNGHQTTYCYDTNDRITQTFDALNHASSQSYDSFSNIVKASTLAGTANAGLSTFTFDNQGSNATQNPTKAEGAAGETTSAAYAVSGQSVFGQSIPGEKYLPSQVTDAQGTSQYFGYDPRGNLTDVKDAQTPRNKATLAYDTKGNVTSSTDGEGRTTTYVYNALGEMTEANPPAPLARQTFTYDALSRVKTIANGRSITRTLTYDKEDRVTAVTLSGSGTGSFTFTFDGDGNATQRTDSAGNSTTYTVDRLGRRTAETFPGSKTNTYVYDKAGNLSSLTDAANQTTSYTYDDVNRVTAVTSPTRYSGTGTSTATYAYTDRAGSAPDQVVMTMPSSATVKPKKTTKFDVSGKVTSIVATDSANATLVNLAYAYVDADSRKTAKVQTQVLDGKTTTYKYADATANEDVGHLVRATVGGSTQKWAYTFDKAGNRLTRAVTDTAGATVQTNYTYNAANQLCASATAPTTPPASNGACPATPPSGVTGYSYDQVGNQVSAGATAAAFDGFDRFTTGSLGYLSPNNGELTAEGTTTYQNATLGLLRTSGAVSSAYTREPSGAPISQRSGTTKEFIVADRLGSTLALIGEAGTQVRSLRYDPDGNTLSNTGSGPDTKLKYAAGHALATGNYHYGARYYNPSTARWTQQDPLNQISDLQQANRYGYAGGDPIGATDPSGLISFEINVGLGPVSASIGVDTNGKVGASAGVGGERAGASASVGVSSGNYTDGQRSAEIGACGPGVCGSANTQGDVYAGLGASTPGPSYSVKQTKVLN